MSMQQRQGATRLWRCGVILSVPMVSGPLIATMLRISGILRSAKSQAVAILMMTSFMTTNHFEDSQERSAKKLFYSTWCSRLFFMHIICFLNILRARLLERLNKL
ncbi:hypothetical protein R3W88_011773 [Solanum pinnatisectum]|uniref:Secreted protein n=1 Tax=Solanum pinnatisectum TaxID=50273 RepID=A0AAV9L734_9SOLN|nr:hypothetical protein R3W88_011773 [Solanum pinnatisectum]